jgi:uncharacterized protein
MARGISEYKIFSPGTKKHAAMTLFGEVILTSGIFLASLLSGMTGLAFPTVAGPLFLLSFAPTEAVMLTALCSLTGQTVSFLSLRRTVPYVLRVQLVAGCIVGVPIGTSVLLVTSRHVVGITIGVLIVLSTAWWLLKPRVLVRAAHPLIEFFVGFAGGICGGMVGVSAAIPALWCAICGLPKENQRALLQPYIVVAQLISGSLLWSYGGLDPIVMRLFAVLLAPIIAGSWLGAHIFRQFSNEVFVRAAMMLTLIGGIVMVIG